MTTQVTRRTLLAFIGPAVFALLIVGIVPLGFAVWKSLHYFNLTKIAQQRFVGIDKYKRDPARQVTITGTDRAC